MDFYTMIGVSDVGFRKMEKTGSLKLVTLAKIADVLKVSVQSLVEFPTELQSGSSTENDVISMLFEIRKTIEDQNKNSARALELIDKYLQQPIVIK